MGFVDLGVWVTISVAINHVIRDYPQGTSSLCFHCNQVGHKKVNCPKLMRRSVRAPAPATLRIIDGREGRVEVPMLRNRPRGSDFHHLTLQVCVVFTSFTLLLVMFMIV